MVVVGMQVLQRRSLGGNGGVLLGNRGGGVGAEFIELFRQLVVGNSQDRHGQVGGILGTVQRHGGDREPAGHLHSGKQCVIIFFTIFGTIAVGNLGIKALIKSCIPVISRYYWFISCYFFLCFLTPFLNQIPEKLSKENFEKLLAVLLLLFSVIPTFGFFEIMQDGGKGLVHMVMIYLLGRYLALYHNRSHNTGRLFLGLFLSIGFIFLADSSLTFVRGKLYTTFCRDCSIFIIFGSVMVLLLFRELNFHSRFINRAAGNVLAVYVLDGTVQTFLLKWIDFKPYAGSWFLVFLAIGYALAIMIIACLLNEVRKATIGRLEPWLVNVVNAVVMWGVNAVRGVVRRLLTYFIG